jgi:hypothetical protein
MARPQEGQLMTRNRKLFVAAALMLAVAAGTAEAGKGGKKGGGGGGGGVPTNYGCQTFAAGKEFVSPDGTSTKRLLISTYTCYICDTTTRICTVQSPSSLAGYLFTY